MTRPRLRAVVLAAGHGTRLRPLTAELPKALLPILGRPLIAWTLERLAAAGVEATAVNLHHRPDAVPAALGDRFEAMPLHYSREETLLGTLGALHPLREFLAPADLVLLVNGDSLCRWPFEELIARQLAGSDEGAPLATLLLSARADVDAFGGGVAVDETGRVLAIPLEREERAAATAGSSLDPSRSRRVAARQVFAGAHAFAPSLALEAPSHFSDLVRDLYRPRLAAGARLETFTTAASWHDLGTAGRYLDAVLDWASREPVGSPTLGSWIDPSASVDPTAGLDAVVVEAEASIAAGVAARDTLVLGGARIGRGSRLERVVVGPGVVVAPGSAIENALITPPRWGVAAGSIERDGHITTPLDAGGRGIGVP